MAHALSELQLEHAWRGGARRQRIARVPAKLRWSHVRAVGKRATVFFSDGCIGIIDNFLLFLTEGPTIVRSSIISEPMFRAVPLHR